MSWLVFTDLDGTLLDHRTYKYDAALPALAALEKQHIPVIIVTSKTRAEVNELRRELKLDYPFIIENGAAIYFPKTYVKQTPQYPWSSITNSLEVMDNYFVKAFAPPMDFWQTTSQHIIENYSTCCTPFSALTDDEVSELTGLALAQAITAKAREYSDPIHWFGSDEQYQVFRSAMVSNGLDVVRGGRFVHLLKGTDKGLAVKWLIDFYSKYNNDTPKSMVLGDGGNDVSMLAVADVPVLIRSEFHDYPDFSSDQAYKTELFGPEGWLEAVSKYIAKA